MSRQVTAGSLAVQGECRTQALAAFVALGLSGAVAVEIREGDTVPYAKIGQFFEVADNDFSDSEGMATRITGSLNFYARQGPDHHSLAIEYLKLMTAPGLSVTGFRVLLHEQDFTLLTDEETDPAGETLYRAIVDHTLTLEPN